MKNFNKTENIIRKLKNIGYFISEMLKRKKIGECDEAKNVKNQKIVTNYKIVKKRSRKSLKYDDMRILKN